jgi:hypothetical protein
MIYDARITAGRDGKRTQGREQGHSNHCGDRPMQVAQCLPHENDARYLVAVVAIVVIFMVVVVVRFWWLF